MNDIEYKHIYQNKGKRRLQGLLKDYPELKQYLENRYADISNIFEASYCILNNLSGKPKCPVCGNDLPFISQSGGYRTFCCNNCTNTIEALEYIVQLRKKTCIKKYGVDSPTKVPEFKEKQQLTMIQKYGVAHALQSKQFVEKSEQTMINRYGVKHSLQNEKSKEKFKLTCIEKYGVDIPYKLDEFKEKFKLTCIEKYGVDNPAKTKEVQEKMKQTCLLKYGVEYISLSEEAKQTKIANNIKKYGVEYTTQLSSVKEKVKQTNILKYGENYYDMFIDKGKHTKKENGTYTTSTIEDILSNELIKKYGENNIIRQYMSQEYPFNCDFYVISLNLYIEIQGSWTHGKHPFQENNKDDIEILNKWITRNTDYYKSAIEVWTHRDVNKRTIAITNKLNYIEIFSNDLTFCLNSINDYITNIYSGYKVYY